MLNSAAAVAAATFRFFKQILSFISHILSREELGKSFLMVDCFVKTLPGSLVAVPVLRGTRKKRYTQKKHILYNFVF